MKNSNLLRRDPRYRAVIEAFKREFEGTKVSLVREHLDGAKTFFTAQVLVYDKNRCYKSLGFKGLSAGHCGLSVTAWQLPQELVYMLKRTNADAGISHEPIEGRGGE